MTNEVINDKSLREKIMSIYKRDVFYGGNKWSVRCERILDYFHEYPEEIPYIDKYEIYGTFDSYYLYRHPNNKKNTRRIGINIGAGKMHNYGYYSIFFFREESD
ncbi:MAG: hypothetical protein QXW39_08160 [Candidatus Bathyarchaeia archaeon]